MLTDLWTLARCIYVQFCGLRSSWWHKGRCDNYWFCNHLFVFAFCTFRIYHMLTGIRTLERCFLVSNCSLSSFCSHKCRRDYLQSCRSHFSVFLCCLYVSLTLQRLDNEKLPLAFVASSILEPEHDFGWMQCADGLVENFFLDYDEARVTDQLFHVLLLHGLYQFNTNGLWYGSMSLRWILLMFALLF